MAVTTKMSALRGVTSCGVVDRYQRFGEHISSIFRVKEISSASKLVTSTCHLLACWFAEPISSTLNMEAICSSETSVATQQTTRRHIPEDDTLHNHHCENLKSYNKKLSFG
jgi:hypothetical protein